MGTARRSGGASEGARHQPSAPTHGAPVCVAAGERPCLTSSHAFFFMRTYVWLSLRSPTMTTARPGTCARTRQRSTVYLLRRGPIRRHRRRDRGALARATCRCDLLQPPCTAHAATCPGPAVPPRPPARGRPCRIQHLAILGLEVRDLGGDLLPDAGGHGLAVNDVAGHVGAAGGSRWGGGGCRRRGRCCVGHGCDVVSVCWRPVCMCGCGEDGARVRGIRPWERTGATLLTHKTPAARRCAPAGATQTVTPTTAEVRTLFLLVQGRDDCDGHGRPDPQNPNSRAFNTRSSPTASTPPHHPPPSRRETPPPNPFITGKEAGK